MRLLCSKYRGLETRETSLGCCFVENTDWTTAWPGPGCEMKEKATNSFPQSHQLMAVNNAILREIYIMPRTPIRLWLLQIWSWCIFTLTAWETRRINVQPQSRIWCQGQDNRVEKHYLSKNFNIHLISALIIVHGICLGKTILNIEKRVCPKVCIVILSIWAGTLKPHTFPIMGWLNKLHCSHRVVFYSVIKTWCYEASVNWIINLVIIHC